MSVNSARRVLRRRPRPHGGRGRGLPQFPCRAAGLLGFAGGVVDRLLSKPHWHSRRAGPHTKIGISDHEVTLAQILKSRGYATAMFGKWHLGDSPQFMPLRHGFDEYFGLPMSWITGRASGNFITNLPATWPP